MKTHKQRNEEATQRQYDRNLRTIEEQIASLKTRRGNSEKEIARLTKKLGGSK